MTNTEGADGADLLRAKELLEEAIVSHVKFYEVYSKCDGNFFLVV
jgi:hypothetical protein